MDMTSDKYLLGALLDSWDRNNKILVNLLLALPDGGLDARATKGSPSVTQMFSHIHYARLVSVAENVPEFATKLPEEWAIEREPNHMAEMLNASAKVVRVAVNGRLHASRDLDLHYDHPILFLQHMIWHEGYHHGQIKLALKTSGHPISDDVAGPVTWDIWMDKKSKSSK
jgi:uncharacterized damage-inducible protein DinB